MKEEKNTIWLTPDEAADYLKCHVSTIYKYMADPVNPLPSYKIFTNKNRINKEELDQWVTKNLKVNEDK